MKKSVLVIVIMLLLVLLPVFADTAVRMDSYNDQNSANRFNWRDTRWDGCPVNITTNIGINDILIMDFNLDEKQGGIDGHDFNFSLWTDSGSHSPGSIIAYNDSILGSDMTSYGRVNVSFSGFSTTSGAHWILGLDKDETDGNIQWYELDAAGTYGDPHTDWDWTYGTDGSWTDGDNEMLWTLRYVVGSYDSYSPPNATLINCTSNPIGDVLSPYNSSGDTTPSFSISWDTGAQVWISGDNSSWEFCGNGSVTNCTLPFSQKIITDPGYVYLVANRTDGINNQSWYELEIIETGAGTGGGGGDIATGNTTHLFQYTSVINYTGLEICRQRTFVGVNFWNDTKTIDLPELIGWNLVSGADPLSMASQSTNITVYDNCSFRAMSDGWFNISAVNGSGSNTLSNNLTDIQPIDPPHAFLKDGVVDCSQNMIVNYDDDLVLNYPLTATGSGTFIINGKLSVPSFPAWDGGETCRFFINSSSDRRTFFVRNT